MGLIDTLRARLKPRSRAELELDYLNQSMSQIDLEHRQREIERGLFRSRPYSR